MGMTKPTGGYAEQMLDPGGWPEVDENMLHDRAQQYLQVLRQVTDVLETCQRQRAEVFDGGAWSGSAASAANGELGTNIDELVTLQNGVVTVITWQKYVAMSIEQAKSDVSDNVEAANNQINALEKDSVLKADERTAAINAVVEATHGANVSVVEGTAEQILRSKAWKPPGNALQDLLDQKIPPPVEIPDTPAATPTPEDQENPQPSPAQPGPVSPAPVSPMIPSVPSSPGASTPGAGSPPTTGTPSIPGQTPGPSVPGAGGTTPAMPVSSPGGSTAPIAPTTPTAPLGPAAPAVPLSPAASAQPQGASGTGKGVTPASVTSHSVNARSEESSASVAPAGGAGMPAAPMGAGAAGGGGGSGRGARAPVGAQSSSGQPSVRPAAAKTAPARPAPTAARAKSATSAASAHRQESVDVVAVPPPPIPVSAARAERDAIADAATADAARRQNDPLRLARRIAAALNAPDSGGLGDFGFFWVTAVTADGTIVVANSYGLAYIPDGVQLPEEVYMASADDTIPAAERARWATYPVMAVQGWADHHDMKLRAVIATEEQLAKSDAGAAKIVLEPDDIPESGGMVGRSRLEVVDPAAADRLAGTADVRLVDLLPPAPATAEPPADQRPTSEAVDPETQARLEAALAEGTRDLQELLAELPDESPPAPDERATLWFDVMKPMMSKASGRTAAHLRAFRAYAAACQEVFLKEAHTAADLVAQRYAVADWLYWKHLTALMDAAMADAPAK